MRETQTNTDALNNIQRSGGPGEETILHSINRGQEQSGRRRRIKRRLRAFKSSVYSRIQSAGIFNIWKNRLSFFRKHPLVLELDETSINSSINQRDGREDSGEEKERLVISCQTRWRRCDATVCLLVFTDEDEKMDSEVCGLELCSHSD